LVQAAGIFTQHRLCHSLVRLRDTRQIVIFKKVYASLIIRKSNYYLYCSNLFAMKKKLILAVVLSAFLFCYSYTQNLVTPQPSPTAEIKQNFGLSQIELSYSRPGVKGRKIFGDLVPYGKVWRTGANTATTITFGDDVMIGDKKIPAGKYGLLTIPGQTEWTVIFTKQVDVTSPADYKEDQDVVRVSVKPYRLPFSIETFTIDFGDIKSSNCKLELMWDSVYVQVPITTDADNKVMTQIKEIMEGDSRPYFQAALYYIENGKDLNQAVQWLDKAATQEPDGFWIYYQKARALAKLGKKQEALVASNKSIELAKTAKNDDYVALNEKLQKTL
jgi:Protein of unknown function (DUF2911)